MVEALEKYNIVGLSWWKCFKGMEGKIGQLESATGEGVT